MAKAVHEAVVEENEMLSEFQKKKLEHLSQVDFLSYCTHKSVHEGLKFNSVRAEVWKEEVAGLGELHRVPLLSDMMIVKRKKPSCKNKQKRNGSEATRVSSSSNVKHTPNKLKIEKNGDDDDDVDEFTKTQFYPSTNGVSSGTDHFNVNLSHSDEDSNNNNNNNSCSNGTGRGMTIAEHNARYRPRRARSQLNFRVKTDTREMNSEEENEAMTSMEGRGSTSLDTAHEVNSSNGGGVSEGITLEKGSNRSFTISDEEFPATTGRGVSISSIGDSGTMNRSWGNQPPAYMSSFILPENCQAKVIDADIKRSLWSLFPEEEERNKMRAKLKEMLLRILTHNQDRYYYQGLHELMGYVLYVLSPHLPYEMIVSVCERLLLTRWRCFSEQKLSGSEGLLYAMHAVIAEADPHLAMVLEDSGVAPESHYAVSWVITWYVHTVTNVDILGRIFDSLVADEDGLLVVFFTAALVMHSRDLILQWVSDAREEAGEMGDDVVVMARVYSNIATLPQVALESMKMQELDELIAKAEQLQQRYTKVVLKEKQNFSDGNIRKLGMLSNARTRNVALRLLWHLLPREWRNPANEHKARSVLFWATGIVFAAAAVAFTQKYQ